MCHFSGETRGQLCYGKWHYSANSGGSLAGLWVDLWVAHLCIGLELNVVGGNSEQQKYYYIACKKSSAVFLLDLEACPQ